MENNLTVLFCLVDDFCKDFMPVWKKFMIQSDMKTRDRSGQMSVSEIITMYIHFH